MKEKTNKIAVWIICSVIVAVGCVYAFLELTAPSGHGKEHRVKMDISTLASALRAYEMDAAALPATEQGLDALVQKPTIEPIPERWKASLKKMITDPWAREYHYRQPGVHNPDGFDLWSLGPDGIESDDDIGNWD